MAMLRTQEKTSRARKNKQNNKKKQAEQEKTSRTAKIPPPKGGSITQNPERNAKNKEGDGHKIQKEIPKIRREQLYIRGQTRTTSRQLFLSCSPLSPSRLYIVSK